jgi:hypothetical protein
MLAFEDAQGFEQAAARALAWGAAAGLLFGLGAGLLAGDSGWTAPEGERLEAGLSILSAAGALGLGLDRRRRGALAGEPVSSRWRLVACLLLGWLFGLFAARTLPPLVALTAQLLGSVQPLASLPALLRLAAAWAVGGAIGALWSACATVALHLVRRESEVARRLGGLRLQLGPELRPLAERVGAAHAGAVVELGRRGPQGALPLRATLDQLAFASLELAERAAGQARVAAPALEDQALRRAAELRQLAERASDAGARSSLERAATAQEQVALRHRSLLAGRERLVARLHEEAAELERAAQSLALLAGAADARVAEEIDLLDERLRAGAEAVIAWVGASADDSRPGMKMGGCPAAPALGDSGGA